jgi:lysozyme
MLSADTIAIFLTRQLAREEGFSQIPYDDKTGLPVKAPVGKLTFGIGWNIQENGITPELARICATYFLRNNEAQLTKDLSWFDALDDVRKCVLIDMSFNMGVAGVEAFKNSLNLVAHGFYTNAGAEMRKSLWYTQVPHRAEPLCVEMETGNWTYQT